jgi:prephenate dehydrogenase
LLAFALAGALSERSDAGELLNYAGAGLRDTTRIAASGSRLWADILLDNRAQTLTALAQFEAQLKHMSAALAAGDRLTLEAAIESARTWRSCL